MSAGATVQELEVRVQNVVATASLGSQLDLVAVMSALPDAKYKPTAFPGAVVKQKENGATFLLFSTGRLVCTGTKSEREARTAVARLVRQLREKGFLINESVEVNIQNVVVSARLPGRVDIERMATTFENVLYEPDQFPGIIYRLPDSKAVALLFASGRLVVVGSKSEEEAHENVRRVYEEVRDRGLLIGTLGRA
ncbi:MAG: TATA box-binding protein [Nitrososphaerota archaeon]